MDWLWSISLSTSLGSGSNDWVVRLCIYWEVLVKLCIECYPEACLECVCFSVTTTVLSDCLLLCASFNLCERADDDTRWSKRGIYICIEMMIINLCVQWQWHQCSSLVGGCVFITVRTTVRSLTLLRAGEILSYHLHPSTWVYAGFSISQ